MLLIKFDSVTPQFTFAAEEYFLKNFDKEFFLLCYQEDSISVGLNQNTLEEINALYVRQNGIKVVRRNSGGGTVFHDKGCLNYSFIVNDDGSAIDDFSKLGEPIISFLKDSLKLDVEFKPRNDLFLDGKKISGMSKYKKNGKIVQHGTLLFSSDIKSLMNALKRNKAKAKNESESIPVANIIDSLTEDIDSIKFMSLLYNYIKARHKSAIIYELTDNDYSEINKIIDEKYSTWDWNFGKSPDYDIKKEIVCPCGIIEVHLKVEQGIIKDVKIFGDFFSECDISELEQSMIGSRHKCDDILKSLKNKKVSCYFGDITNRFFVESLFL